MLYKILQVNLKFSIKKYELEQAWLEVARPISEWPGLLWKLWLMNEKDNEAGGIYLFESETAALSYLSSPIVEGLKSSPVISDITAKLFDIIEAHTTITRGPLNQEFNIKADL